MPTYRYVRTDAFVVLSTIALVAIANMHISLLPEVVAAVSEVWSHVRSGHVVRVI